MQLLVQILKVLIGKEEGNLRIIFLAAELLLYVEYEGKMIQ